MLQEPMQEGNQNFIKALSEEIAEIKDITGQTNTDIKSVENKVEKNILHGSIANRKLDNILEAIGNLPKVEEKRVMIFPEFSDYNFSKIFFRNMFMWAAIAVISIVFLNKLFPLLKGDAHRYKKAWKELYKSKLQKEKFTMDSVLFYGKGVELDSIGKK